MIDLLCIGDIKLDAFIRLETSTTSLSPGDKLLQIPNGKKNNAKDVELHIAGSAPNVATALKLMKRTAAVCSTMGNDAIYHLALEELTKRGIDTTEISAKKGLKNTFAAVLNYRGESTQVVGYTANPYKTPKRASTWIHVAELGTGYESLFNGLIKKAKQGTRISFNPGSLQIAEAKPVLFKLIAATDTLFVNKQEAQELLKTTSTKTVTLLKGLLELGPKTVVITDGKKGADAMNNESMWHAPMFPGRRVEATGAGDAFTSGFLGAVILGKPLDVALAWGSVNAANVVQHVGPTAGLQTPSAIGKQLASHKSYRIKTL